MATIFTKALIASAAALTFASTAHASTVSFQYDKSASAAMNYKTFEKTADQYCRDEVRRSGFGTGGTWEQRQCSKEMVAKAVKASKNATLIAFHAYSVNPQKDAQAYASSK